MLQWKQSVWFKIFKLHSKIVYKKKEQSKASKMISHFLLLQQCDALTTISTTFMGPSNRDYAHKLKTGVFFLHNY